MRRGPRGALVWAGLAALVAILLLAVYLVRSPTDDAQRTHERAPVQQDVLSKEVQPVPADAASPYRPLDPALRTNLKASLGAIAEGAKAQNPWVKIETYATARPETRQFAKDLAGVLREAGFAVDESVVPRPPGGRGTVAVFANPDRPACLVPALEALREYIVDTTLVLFRWDAASGCEFKLRFYGDPVFSTRGQVTFPMPADAMEAFKDVTPLPSAPQPSR